MQRPPDTHLCARLLLAGALLATGALAGCASTGTTPPSTPLAAWPDRLQALLTTDVLLLGEQHDAPEHQRLQRETVLWLAAKGQLAAVVMEMAESGHSTQALPRDATDAQAQAALQWNDAAWPWKAYGPVVMAAVAAGVPVLGGNLPRAQMRAAMGEARWDQHLPAPALAQQHQALRSLGVPTHWPAGLVSKVALAQSGQSQTAIKNGANKPGDAEAVIETPALPPRDACAELREKWRPARPAP